MLNVPTLWTAFVINFLALGLIWAYILHSYPSLKAARYWTGSALGLAAGSLIATLMLVTDSLTPLLLGGTTVVFASCLTAMGIRRFYGEPVLWRQAVALTALTFAGLLIFIFGYDSATARIMIFSVAQALPLALSLKLLLSKQDGRANAGARLAAGVAMAIIATCAFRALSKLLQIGTDFTFT